MEGQFRKFELIAQRYNWTYFLLYISSVEKDKYSLYLAITFGAKNIQDFSNASFFKNNKA